MQIEHRELISMHRGYHVQRCTIAPDDYSDALILNLAFSTIDGGFIGTAKEAALYDRFRILPQKARPEDEDASIGWCEKEQKWYGWGPQDIRGFGVGDELVGQTVLTLEMARECAIAVADILRGKLI